MNRMVVEIVRSMLSDAKLPKNFWAEALSTAVYLHNRSPTRAVLKKTPFEALPKEKPVVDHFKVFGGVLYVMHMSLRMTGKSLMLRQKGALCWDMALKLKHISFMILKRRK